MFFKKKAQFFALSLIFDHDNRNYHWLTAIFTLDEASNSFLGVTLGFFKISLVK